LVDTQSNIYMTFWDTQIRVDIEIALECMAEVLGKASDDVLLVSTVFGDYVGPGDCHLLGGSERALPSDEVLFNLTRRVGAKELLLASRSSGPITQLHEPDVLLFERLLAAVVRNDLKILDHVVVAPGGLIRFMRESIFEVPGEQPEFGC
jgi:hypothetical protein